MRRKMWEGRGRKRVSREEDGKRQEGKIRKRIHSEKRETGLR